MQKFVKPYYFALLCLLGIVMLVGFCNSTKVLPIEQISANDDSLPGAVYEISDSPSALPIQIEKIRINCLQLTARQQYKNILESVFGRYANSRISFLIQHIICRLSLIRLNLPPAEISFPFSTFW